MGAPLSLSLLPNRGALALLGLLALLCWPIASRATPAMAGHGSPTFTAAEEDAYLAALIERSPHRRALAAAAAQYGDLYPEAAIDLSQPAQSPSYLFASNLKAWPAKKGRRLYGYLPYWTMKSAKLHWAELTQLAYFGAELKPDGSFGKLHGWGSADAKKLITTAHQHGVQVTLTVTLFSKSGISQVLATAAKRSALVKSITALVIKGGGDGVNIDFEGMAKADKARMNAFITELNAVMKQQLPGADVTLATPAVDWSRAWDYATLLDNSDGLMVMAYGLHWSGGNPGPNLPMAAGGVWKHKTLPWVVDDYAKWGKAKNLPKVIIGLPLYGRAWLSSSGKPGAKALAKGKSVTYEKAQVEAPTKSGWKWDATSQSSYYTDYSGGKWTQTWADTAKAFGLRVAYVDKRGTQMGLWALGYADKEAPVWQAIAGFMAKGKPGGGGGPDAGGTDAGGTDAGGPDAGGAGGTTDAGAQDAGAQDAGAQDAGAQDAGAQDAGAQDAGSADTNKSDTGESDTSKWDTGESEPTTSDAGSSGAADVGGRHTPPDSGAASGGSDAAALDAVAHDAAPAAPIGNNLAPQPDSGCGAAPRPAAPIDRSARLGWLLALALAGVALVWRRRRPGAGRSAGLNP